MEQENYGREMTTDRYTESIEVSNKCREFYLKRMEDAENRKQSAQTIPTPRGGRNTSIDKAMSKLREEMVSFSLCWKFRRENINVYTTEGRILMYTTEGRILMYTTEEKILMYTTEEKILMNTTEGKILMYTMIIL